MKKYYSIIFIFILFTQIVRASDIFCSIGVSAITIKSGRTTLTVNNQVGFAVSFQKTGHSNVVSAPSSIYVTDGNNDKITFTRTAAQQFALQDKRYGKGRQVLMQGRSSDANLLCNIYFEIFDRYPDVVMVRTSF